VPDLKLAPLFQLVAGALGGCGGKAAASAFRCVVWFCIAHCPGGPLPRYCGRPSIHAVKVRGNRALNGVSCFATSTSLTFVILHGCQVGPHVFIDSSVGVGLWRRVPLYHTDKPGAAQGDTPARPMSFFLRNMAECSTQRFIPNCIAREWLIRKVAVRVAGIPVPVATPLWSIFGVGSS
jgi:hypothetical protein